MPPISSMSRIRASTLYQKKDLLHSLCFLYLICPGFICIKANLVSNANSRIRWAYLLWVPLNAKAKLAGLTERVQILDQQGEGGSRKVGFHQTIFE